MAVFAKSLLVSNCVSLVCPNADADLIFCGLIARFLYQDRAINHFGVGRRGGMVVCFQPAISFVFAQGEIQRNRIACRVARVPICVEKLIIACTGADAIPEGIYIYSHEILFPHSDRSEVGFAFQTE